MSVERHHRQAPASVTCAVLTVSDTRTLETDESGSLIVEALKTAGHKVAIRHIVADESERIAAAVRMLADDVLIDAVIVTGGTGIAPRDRTYEAVGAQLTTTIDGFGELFRMLSYQEVGAAAMLSRAVAGLVGTTVVFVLPGSTAACKLAMERLILPELTHAVALANPHRAGN